MAESQIDQIKHAERPHITGNVYKESFAWLRQKSALALYTGGFKFKLAAKGQTALKRKFSIIIPCGSVMILQSILFKNGK